MSGSVPIKVGQLWRSIELYGHEPRDVVVSFVSPPRTPRDSAYVAANMVGDGSRLIHVERRFFRRRYELIGAAQSSNSIGDALHERA